MKKLRYFQQDAINTVDAELHKGIKNQLVVIPTGGGKTFTAVKLIAHFNFKRILWLTHNEELISQSAFALLDEEFAENNLDAIKFRKDWSDILEFKASMKTGYGIFGDNRNSTPEAIFANKTLGIIKAEWMETGCPITMASIQSIHRRLNQFSPKNFDCVIVDEAHMALAKTWSKTISYFTPKLTLGLTATPFRGDGMPLTNLFDKISYEFPIEKAIEEGYLCEPDAIRVKSDLNLDNVRTTAGEFNQKDLEQAVNTPQRNNLIVDAYEKYALGRKFLAYGVDVQHAQDLHLTFQRRGHRTEIVVGDTEITTDRSGIIHDFKTTEKYEGLVNCMILTTGTDIPEVSCIIPACPTKSKTKFLQILGRGLRLKDGIFKDCIILDIVDNTRKHSLVNTETLDADKPIEKKIFLSKKKKLKLLEVAAQRKFKAETKADEKVNLFKLPAPPKIYHSGRNLEEATEGQLKWIAREGYDTTNIEYTKAMCSEIISTFQEWDKNKIAIVKNNGYDISGGLTIGQCAAAIKEIEARKLTNSKIALPFSDL